MPSERGCYFILRPNHTIEPVDVITWAQWFHEPKNRIVAQEDVGPYFVSTVFLGMDFNLIGKLMLFETMIFSNSGSIPPDEYQTRCSTWDEALKMHETAVQVARDWPTRKIKNREA